MEASPHPMAAPTGHPSQVGEGRGRAVAGRGHGTGVQRGWGHFRWGSAWGCVGSQWHGAVQLLPEHPSSANTASHPSGHAQAPAEPLAPSPLPTAAPENLTPKPQDLGRQQRGARLRPHPVRRQNGASHGCPTGAHLLAGRERRPGAGGGSRLRVIFILQDFIQVPYGLLFLLHGLPGTVGVERGTPQGYGWESLRG